MSVVTDTQIEATRWQLPKSNLQIQTAKTPYGLGVFACDPIPAGMELGQILGEVIEGSDYESDYAMDLGPDLTLEPAAPYRYVNHSCEPNCALYQIDYEDDEGNLKPVMVLEAIQNISAGDQLSIDYGWPAEQAIPCECNAPKCRGLIVDAKEVKMAKKMRRKNR